MTKDYIHERFWKYVPAQQAYQRFDRKGKKEIGIESARKAARELTRELESEAKNFIEAHFLTGPKVRELVAEFLARMEGKGRWKK